MTKSVAFDVKTFAMSTGPYSLNTRVFGGCTITWVVQLRMAIFREQISYWQFNSADIMQGIFFFAFDKKQEQIRNEMS